MLNPIDVTIIREGLEEAIRMENSLSDRLEITFSYISRTASGGDVARHYDNAPLNAWDDDDGFTATTNPIILPCTYIPKTTSVNLVQEGYHPDSEVEVIILNQDLEAADVSVDDIRNTFEYASMVYPHEIDMRGRTSESITRVWSVMSVRPIPVSNQLVGIIVGLALREQDTTQIGIKDI